MARRRPPCPAPRSLLAAGLETAPFVFDALAFRALWLPCLGMRSRARFRKLSRPFFAALAAPLLGGNLSHGHPYPYCMIGKAKPHV